MEFISGTMYWGNFPGEYPHNPFRRFARDTPLLSHPMLKNTPGMPP